tara:strand:- start:534 stop:794 length:261 start_codon:yes stop_codon:yes gene_type:complete
MKQTKILFFSSSTCGPCRLAKSRLTEQEIEELNIEILSDEDWESFVFYEVQTVPTFLKINLENNEVINRQAGFSNVERLAEDLRSL